MTEKPEQKTFYGGEVKFGGPLKPTYPSGSDEARKAGQEPSTFEG
jgi:hypothetical protein